MDRDEQRKREDSHLRNRQLDWQYQQTATERELELRRFVAVNRREPAVGTSRGLLTVTPSRGDWRRRSCLIAGAIVKHLEDSGSVHDWQTGGRRHC